MRKALKRLLDRFQGDIDFTTGNGDGGRVPRSPLDEAADPATPAERLRELTDAALGGGTPYPGQPLAAAGGVERRLLAAVAGNPNTPPDLLAGLAPTHPAEFCANPVAPLLLLEQPGFLGTVWPGTLHTLLAQGDLPALLVTAISHHPDPGVTEAARLHVTLAGEPERDGWEAEVSRHLRGLPVAGSDADLLELWELGVAPAWVGERLAGSDDRRVRFAALLGPLAPQTSIARSLADAAVRASGSPDLSRASADFDPTLEPDALVRLAGCGPWLRRVAARHPNTPPDVLARLAEHDPDRWTRAAAARNPRTPAASLARVATGPDDALRLATARNPAANGELLWSLACDGNKLVRAMVGRHPAASPDLLAALADDPEPEVRAAALRHPSAPRERVDAGAADPSVVVRWAVERRGGKETRAVAAPAAAPQEVPPSRVPAPPSEERAMGRKALRTLPADRGGRMRAALDRRTPPALLEQIAEVGDDALRAAVARNPATPAETLRRLGAKRTPNQWGGVELHPLWRALATNPNTPAEVLRRLVHAPQAGVRVALAGNPALPEASLRELADDGAAEVRRAACVEAARRSAGTERAVAERARCRALQTAAYGVPGSLRRLLSAAHPATPNQQTDQLARSGEWRDRLAAALNPRTPAATVTRLADDGIRPVRAAARARLADRARLLGLLPGGAQEGG